MGLKSGSNLSLEPSNCIREAEEYARNAAAMIAFFKKAVATGSKVLSPVCDAATLAYIDATIDKDPDDKAKEKAVPTLEPTKRPQWHLL